jgi:hypothetical protein
MLANLCTNCPSAGIDLFTSFFSRNCTDPLASNYNPAAVVDDGSSEYASCYGCDDEEACNYSETSAFNDGSCCYNRCVNVTMTTSEVPEDMSWQLLDTDSTVVALGGFVDNQFLCLADSCYIVVLADTAANGWGSGSFSLADEVGFLAQDTTVADSVDVVFDFCLSGQRKDNPSQKKTQKENFFHIYVG